MNRANIVCAAVAGCAALGVLMAAGSPSQPGAAAAQPAQPAANGTESGYSIGFDIGREVSANLKRDGVGADVESVVRGFSDALRGVKPAYSDEKMAQVLTELQAKIDDERNAKMMSSDPAFKASASAAAAMSKSFMEKFAELEGVKPLENGIYYLVKKTGTGDAVGNARAVVMNYQAFLSRREQVADKQGVEVAIGGMVPGAQAVLRKMRVGDRWYVAIPPEQAFGSRGLQPNIGPNEAVIVDVEVLEVKK
jgi:FKBP-type peptidyl-prolyl cis-trans isomerase FklB